MNKFPTICILGSQPKLGLAELESVFGAKCVKPLGNSAAALDVPAGEVDLSMLGGTVRVCRLLTELKNDFKAIKRHLAQTVPEHVDTTPEGKLTVGVSAFDVRWTVNQANELAHQVKTSAKSVQKSVRTVPNKTLSLNSAQVIHNKLIGRKGWELVFVGNGNEVVMAQTVAIQDIEAYAARDQARPRRDARVGMLPPKLAQIIINLGLGAKTNKKRVIMDPFCGTGVILQESLMMGNDAVGSDLDERMVSYTKTNIDWLANKFQPSGKLVYAVQGDATDYHWDKINQLEVVIASEVFLGKPLQSQQTTEELKSISSKSNEIVTKFLENIGSQIQSGTRLCLALPVWKTRNGSYHLPLIDQLEKIGYNRLSFVHTRSGDLVYLRPDQFVGRELVVITRK